MADISTLTVGGTKYQIKDNIANGGHYGGTGNTTKIKININSTVSWMLSFVVTLYQGYRATKIMVSGYNYGNNYWYEPEAVILGDSNYTETITAYFGYDAANKLWVGFDGGNYTGVTITDVVNGYTQITDYTNLFTISNVSSLATIQKTVTAESRANYANSAGSVAWESVTGKPSSFTPASHDHNRVLDVGNSTATTFAYSKAGMDTTSWFAAWNGYELRAISPAKTLSTIGALSTTGGTLTGGVTATKAGEIGYAANNTTKAHQVEFIVGSSGNGGVYDRTNSKWVVYSDTAGSVILNGNANTATTATNLSGFQKTTTTNIGIDTSDTNQAIGYVNGLTKADWNSQQTDGALYKQSYSSSWIHQIFGDYRTGQISVRGKNNGTWQAWRKVLDSSNFTSYVTPTAIGAAASHSHPYLSTAGGTLTGNLTVGTTSQSAAPTAGIFVHDTRSYAWTPTSLSKSVNWFFSNNAMPDSGWWAGMSLHGWTGDYNSWQLVGPANAADQRTTPLYVRTGRTTNGWGSWRKIYDTSNKPTYTDVGAAAASHGHGVNTGSAYNSVSATAACATALNTTSVATASVSGTKLVIGTASVATSIKSTANAITSLGTGTFATSVKNS